MEKPSSVSHSSVGTGDEFDAGREVSIGTRNAGSSARIVTTNSSTCTEADASVSLPAVQREHLDVPSMKGELGAVERMMRELGGGGFTVRPLSQFTAPAPGTSSVPAGPDSSAADDPDADPRGKMSIFDDSVTLVAGDDSVQVSAYGAHILSWKVDSIERLWLSSLSATDMSAPVRGGIPIAFPQFARQGALPLHGFAREKKWRVDKVCSVSRWGQPASVILTLDSDSSTRAVWNHAFKLELTITLQPKQLNISLRVHNTGTTACLHTYLCCSDVSDVRLRGLKGVAFKDKAANGWQGNDLSALSFQTQQEDDLDVAQVCSSHPTAPLYFIDRVYTNAPKQLQLTGTAGSDSCITVSQSDSFDDTVLFNPWSESRRGDKGPDFDDDGYTHMLCVEAAAATKAVEVPVGHSWGGWQTLQVLK